MIMIHVYINREEALSLTMAKDTAMAAFLLSSPCAVDKLAGRSCLWAGKSRAAPGFVNGEMMSKRVKAINVGKTRLERMSLNHVCSTAFSNGVCDTIKVQDQLDEEVVNVKEMHQVLIMNGGVGETSYAINSLLQKTAMCTAMPMLQKVVADLCTTFSCDTIRLADLGCSSGPNTLVIVTFLVESFIEKLRQLGRRPPEFQVFLNDLPINDFNTLFLSLPAFYERLRGEKNMVGEAQGSCFVAGVPGSFYSRLFPSRSLHLIHSSYSVHWLSQVPPLLQSTATLPANKGNIYMAKTSPPSVFASYLNQFQKDFSLFLNYRKEELVPGGKMVVNLIGRRSPDYSSRECCRLWELLSESLKDMALEGIIEKEKLDTYNMPYYTPSSYEIKRIVEKEGSFDVEIKVTEVNWDPVEDQMKEYYVFDKVQSGKNVAKYIRASNESMLGYHFGEAVMDDLFERFADKVGDHLSKEKTKHVNLVVSLTRKG